MGANKATDKPPMSNPQKERIKRVAKRVLAGNGKTTIAAAMREEGYPEATARNPQQLTQSKTWAEIMAEYIPEQKTAEIHKQLLSAGKLQKHNFDPSLTEADCKAIIEQIPGCTFLRAMKQNVPFVGEAMVAFFTSPDNRTRTDALDMAYKLRGSYAAEKHLNTNLNFSLADLRKAREQQTE